jgi:hypothetical protein
MISSACCAELWRWPIFGEKSEKQSCLWQRYFSTRRGVDLRIVYALRAVIKLCPVAAKVALQFPGCIPNGPHPVPKAAQGGVFTA